MTKQLKFMATLTISLSVALIVLVVLFIVPNTNLIIEFSAENPLLGPLIIILWRILAIVIPPIPGAAISLALVPVFGWWQSFIYAAIGVLSGTTISFWLARVFREPLVRRFVPLQKLHSWQEKLSPKTEFFVFIGIILATAPVTDFMSYIAGISRIGFWKFIGAISVSILPNVIIYYFGELAFKLNVYFGIIYILLYLLIFYIFRKRDFFTKNK